MKETVHLRDREPLIKEETEGLKAIIIMRDAVEGTTRDSSGRLLYFVFTAYEIVFHALPDKIISNRMIKSQEEYI